MKRIRAWKAGWTKSCFDLFCVPVYQPVLRKPSTAFSFPSGSRNFMSCRTAIGRSISKFIGSIPSRAMGIHPTRNGAFCPFTRPETPTWKPVRSLRAFVCPACSADRERLTGRRSSYAGTDAFMSIVDGDMAPCSPEVRQLGHSRLVHQPASAHSKWPGRGADRFHHGHQRAGECHSYRSGDRPCLGPAMCLVGGNQRTRGKNGAAVPALPAGFCLGRGLIFKRGGPPKPFFFSF